MKLKTISAILAKKHQDFCESITNPEVRKMVEQNSIITGGSIVSMLLNEKVNDFDYYFTNSQTVLAVAEYFVEQFNASRPDIKASIVDETESGRIKIFIKSKGVAGDFPEDEELPEDIDIVEEEPKKEPVDKPRYCPTFLSSNAITLSNKVQLIIRFYGEPEEIHKNYDFVHCTGYWTSKDKKLEISKEALEAILTKELRYVGSEYPLCSIIRTRKFIERGWTINAGQYLKMCMQLNELDLTNVNVLEDQLVGVDVAYFVQVIRDVKNRQEEEPEFKVDSAYLTTIIDKIF